MQARKCKGCLAVIETYRLPTGSGMAPRAIRAELSLVHIVHRVTRETSLRRSLIQSIFVAARTGCTCMHPDQRERCSGMIKAHRLPITGRMAFRAVRAQLPVVSIILFVARKAIHGRAFVHAIDMAICTWHIYMSTNQLEGGTVVIECRGSPTLGRVTRGAICP
jgi:hypothetical protein